MDYNFKENYTLYTPYVIPMQSFDAEINEITFSFIRVTYGSGELWYHISFGKDDKRVTFRMLHNEDDTSQISDTKDEGLLLLADQFSECIRNFEKKLLITKGRGDIIKAAVERLTHS